MSPDIQEATFERQDRSSMIIAVVIAAAIGWVLTIMLALGTGVAGGFLVARELYRDARAPMQPAAAAIAPAEIAPLSRTGDGMPARPRYVQ